MAAIAASTSARSQVQHRRTVRQPIRALFRAFADFLPIQGLPRPMPGWSGTGFSAAELADHRRSEQERALTARAAYGEEQVAAKHDAKKARANFWVMQQNLAKQKGGRPGYQFNEKKLPKEGPPKFNVVLAGSEAPKTDGTAASKPTSTG
jgi:hypothetical protein